MTSRTRDAVRQLTWIFDMKLNLYSVLFIGLNLFNCGYGTDALAKEEVPLEIAKPALAVSDLKEALQERTQSEGSKEGGTETQKQLPLCKGSYSKVRWTDCRGVKREYNGPHFIGQSYEGDFKEGRPHGHGDMRYHDGTRFVGVFEMGVRDGAGTEYAKNGDLIREGYWRAGVLVKTTKTGPVVSQGGKE